MAQDTPPDLVLLDISMPGIGGYGFLEQWRNMPNCHQTPVICVTALDSDDSELKGFELGAVDYITKPFAMQTIQARVKTHLELRAARTRIEAHNRRLQDEREIVEEIINRLRNSENFEPGRLRYKMASVDKTNGDLLLSASTPSGKQWIMVGDVAGHGLPAAVCAPLVSFLFYRQAELDGDLAETLQMINRVMCEQLPTQMYMPCCVIELDRISGGCRLWNTGLPGCLKWNTNGEIEQIGSNLLPLGVVHKQNYAAQAEYREIKPGERFYFFTDGLTELTSPEGEMFGLAGAIELISDLSSADDFEALIGRLQDFRGGADFLDDITLVEITV